MKKIPRFVFVMGIVICLLALEVASVFANGFVTPAIVWEDPTATNPDKAVTFNTAVLDPTLLPGTLTGNSGMLLPVGFPTGEKQFGGNGIQVSGLTGGNTVQVCFSFPTYKYSWAGMIFNWDGAKWVNMPTIIMKPNGDESTYCACTSKAGNGIYALLIGFYGTPEPVLIPDSVPLE